MPAAEIPTSATDWNSGDELLAILQDFEDRIYALENP